MSPETRFEALAAAGGELLETVADQILATGVEIDILAGPEVFSAPLRLPIPGAGTTTVVIGHIALTRCTVTLGPTSQPTRGDGCRAGRDLTGALAAAICDAEAERDGPAAMSVAALVADTAATRRALDVSRANDVALTRVDGG